MGLQEIALAHWREAQDNYVAQEEAAERAKIQKRQAEVTGQLQDWLRAALPAEWVAQAQFTTELVWPYVIAHLDGVNFTVTPVYGENHLVLVERCPNCGEFFHSDSVEGLESLGQQIETLNQGWRPGHTCDPEMLDELRPKPKDCIPPLQVAIDELAARLKNVPREVWPDWIARVLKKLDLPDDLEEEQDYRLSLLMTQQVIERRLVLGGW